ncbi:MAG TPA: insulinase family protein, partial [Jiangellaceae bacterium]|nr:insulinase family protein [Jiangellaceae bacterium]
QVLDAVRAGGWELDAAAAPVARRTAAGTALPDSGRSLTLRRSTEQANVILGCQGLTARDERRWALSVLMTALGGGMSSRLFQEVRERRGLAYATYAFASSYAEAGTVGLYAGCAPENTAQVVGLLGHELDRIAAEPMPAEELDRAIGQLCGSIVLGLEDTSSRMSRLGRAEIVFGEITTIEETLDHIRAVTAEQVQEMAAELAARPRSLVVVGPFEHDVAAEALAAIKPAPVAP